MLSYEREFSDTLPLAVGDKQPPTQVDVNGLMQIIREEIEFHATETEASSIANILKKLDIATLMLALGDPDDLLYRGAVELQRVIGTLVAQRYNLDVAYRFDELAQLYMKAGGMLPEVEEYELSDTDVGMFEALGSFGRENDRYNEQPLSHDYCAIIDEVTTFGDITCDALVAWLME